MIYHNIAYNRQAPTTKTKITENTHSQRTVEHSFRKYTDKIKKQT